MIKEIDIKGKYRVKVENRFFTLTGSEIKNLIAKHKLTILAVICKVN